MAEPGRRFGAGLTPRPAAAQSRAKGKARARGCVCGRAWWFRPGHTGLLRVVGEQGDGLFLGEVPGGDLFGFAEVVSPLA